MEAPGNCHGARGRPRVRSIGNKGTWKRGPAVKLVGAKLEGGIGFKVRGWNRYKVRGWNRFQPVSFLADFSKCQPQEAAGTLMLDSPKVKEPERLMQENFI